MDSEDSAPIKMFLSLWWWFGGKQRWPPVVVWVVEKKVLGFGWAFGEEESEKKLCFSH